MAQMNVNLAFSADTGKAKAQIAELQSLLSKIAYTGSTANATNTLQKDLQEASTAAKELQFHLNNAFNVSTGKFDLSMLDKSLKTSGSNITDLSTKLLGAGATGQQAFATLAQSISLADQPMLRVSKRMQDFAVTMKNTVKWQLSSSMLHGFMGAIQSAYGYAQDLNKSLTDIRIVTGYSADQMAVFAEQANKAAKSLSTTTTDYTNASLIYFQQGLSDAEVAARTDITVKMANAAGQSAEVVSEQLTAVWNNFADGSKSLEYYADVMTALGAATASSSDEISEGLSKFAAVAESVGLSYEYATAALTTITSNTRESADVVGNALKTLFARLQGLKLGETLEDGVDLNKYSEALDKAGISIFEQSGELKAMDNILSELAGKWDTMSNAQQVALAQTVAGVRQYTQLIALMENWDNGDSDSFMANLNTIENAEGALQNQADIYADSWEAAQKRVQAAAEGIYQSLLDDDFFISINNGFANLLGGLDAFIDGAGGIKTVLTGIASVIITSFANKIPEALNTFKYNLEVITKGSQAAYQRIQNQMQKATQKAFDDFKNTAGQEGIQEDSATGYAIKQANELTAARNKLEQASDRMSAAEKQSAEISLSLIQAQQNEVIALKQKNDELKESIELQQQSIRQQEINGATKQKAFEANNALSESFDLIQNEISFDQKNRAHTKSGKIKAEIDQRIQEYNSGLEQIKNFSKAFQEEIDVINEGYDILGKQIFEKYLSKDMSGMSLFGNLDFESGTTGLEKMVSQIDNFIQKTDLMSNPKNFQVVKDEIAALGSTIPKAIQEATGLDTIFRKIADNKLTSTTEELQINFNELKDKLKEAKIEGKDFEKILKSFYGNSINKLSTDMSTLASNEDKAAKKAGILKNLLNEFNPTHIVRTSEALGALAGLMGNVVTVANSTISMFKAWGNPDLSGWEKVSATLSGIAMIVPTAMSSLRGLSTIISHITTKYGAQIAVMNLSSGAHARLASQIGAETIAEIANIAAKNKSEGASKTQAAAEMATYLMKEKGISKIQANTAAQFMSNKVYEQGGKSILTYLAAQTAKIINDKLENSGRTAGIILQTILNALTGQYAAIWMVLAGIGIVALITAIVAGLDALIVTQKEANEAITKANSKYDEEKQKLDELKSSLKSVQDQIEELQSQDSLSLVEQEELDKLLEQEASLQRQVALQEQLAQAAKQKSADTFEKNVKTASDWMNKAPDNKKTVTLFDKNLYGKIFTPEQFLAEINKLYTDEEGNILEGFEDKYAKAYKYYENWVNDYNSKQAEWVNANKDSFNEVTEGYQNWFDIYGNKEGYEEETLKYAKLVSDMNKAIYGDQYDDKVLGSMDKTFEASQDKKDKGVTDTIIKDLSDGTGAVEASAADIAAGFSDSFKNSLLKQGILPEDYAQHLIDEYSHVAKALEGTGVTLNDLLAGGMSLEDFDILAQIKITGEDDLNSILEKIEAYKSNNIEVGFNLQDFKNNYSFAQGVEDGKSYSADDIAQLDIAYQQYFQEQLDGSYQLKISASEFKEIVESIELGKLKEEIQNQKKTLNAAGEMTEEEFTSYQTGQASNRQLVEAMGGTWSETDQEANIEATQAAAVAYSDLAASLMANSEAASLTAENTAELDALLNSGMISLEDYNARLAEMRNILDEDIDAEQYENLTEILQSMAEASDDNREGAQEFSEDLKDNKKAAQEVAKAILRYDSAVEDVKKNSKDWMKILKSGNLQDMADIMDDLTNSYEDMLDLDGDVLSDDFVTNTENLELMQEAAEGSEEAYNELAKRASEDIIAQCKLEADFDQTKFDAALANFQSVIAGIDLPNLEVGADLTGVPGFIDACNQIINAAGMTADQATSYLASMGIDAEVEQETETKQDVVATSLTPNTTLRIQPYTVPAADGSPMTAYASFPMVSYTQSPIYGTKETTATALRVKSANKASGGGIKHANSSSGSGSNSKPSGGGGGGGSAPKHAEKKNDSDKERYHTLNNQLEDLESQYDSISDAADRAFGQDKLDNLDKQIEKTQELIDKNEEYLAEAEKNASIDKSVMEAYYNKSIGGPAIQYDENGNITNFDEIQDAAYAKYNQMAETYDEESNEWIQFEKDYEQFMKYLELYEESTDLVRDKKAEAERLAAEKIDLELEKVQYSIEIQLEVPEDQLKVIDFQLERIEDDAFNSAESMNLLIQKANLFNREIETTKQGLIDTLGVTLSDQEINQILSGDMNGIDTSKFTEDQVSAIREYKDSLLELNQELLDIQQQIEDEVMETFEEYHEELDRGMEKFDHYNHMLESYQNIVDIVGKDVLGLDNEALADISEAQVENSINQLKASKDAYDSLQKQADDALQKQQEAEMKAALARAKGDEETAKSYEEDAEFWKETYTEMNEAAVEAQEEMMDNWGNTLEAIATQFELAVERAVEAFNDAIYEFGGLEGMSDDFSRQKEMDDMYLEDYQQIYELSKLTRDINNTIDDTENIAGKQKLKKLLEEINQLQEDGVEMSEYDLEYLQAEYNLRLAELELEEAQKAKDTVRLSRDNEGNWSYVYTQNTDAVDAAQQKYEDALYAMQDLSSNYIDEMSEQLIATSQEMQEALANVRVEDFASQEEYYAELARIEAQYQEQMAAQEAELNKAIANNKELYDTDWKNYSEATGYKISKAEEFATKFSDTLLGSLVGSEEATSNFTAIVGEATDSLVQGLANAAATYYTNLNTAMEAAGTSTSEFADLLAEDVEAIKADSKEAADAVADMAKKMDEEMTKITERVQKFQEDYGREIDKIIAKNLEMVETFNDMLEHLSIDPDQINVTYDISRSQDGEGGETVEVPEGTASGYTGMYTGDWGSNEGRVAVLHEKELLLNQDDTVNMLEALKISKYMLEILNANTQMMSQGMGTMLPASIDNSISEVLEQQVSIVAEFPNAVNHSEIEEAFDTLINRAAQYANRK